MAPPTAAAAAGRPPAAWAARQRALATVSARRAVRARTPSSPQSGRRRRDHLVIVKEVGKDEVEMLAQQGHWHVTELTRGDS